MLNKTGLYIHIPFCIKKCDYCDFLSFGGMEKSVMENYVSALCEEISTVQKDTGITEISTIYIGGGTPSVLTPEMFHRLMTSVEASFVLSEGGEFTVEVNPGTASEVLIDMYHKHGVNRVSMGLQSDDDEILGDIGRIHTYNDFLQTYNLLIDKGINNISVDLMFGLPNQKAEQWQTAVEHVIELNPNHISAYSLIIEEGTPFEERYEAGEMMLVNEEEERAMFWMAHDMLQKAGYHHYEISNYAKPGYEAVHNSSYWDMTPYIGVGLGASSYYNNIRYKNVTELNTYVEARGALELIRTIEHINEQEDILEEIFFLGLRQLDGIDLQSISDIYGYEAVTVYYDVINELLTDGLLIGEGMFLIPNQDSLMPIAKNIKLSKRGVDISNQVMARFLL